MQRRTGNGKYLNFTRVIFPLNDLLSNRWPLPLLYKSSGRSITGFYSLVSKITAWHIFKTCPSSYIPNELKWPFWLTPCSRQFGVFVKVEVGQRSKYQGLRGWSANKNEVRANAYTKTDLTFQQRYSIIMFEYIQTTSTNNTRIKNWKLSFCISGARYHWESLKVILFIS